MVAAVAGASVEASLTSYLTRRSLRDQRVSSEAGQEAAAVAAAG